MRLKKRELKVCFGAGPKLSAKISKIVEAAFGPYLVFKSITNRSGIVEYVYKCPSKLEIKEDD